MVRGCPIETCKIVKGLAMVCPGSLLHKDFGSIDRGSETKRTRHQHCLRLRHFSLVRVANGRNASNGRADEKNAAKNFEVELNRK